MDRARFNTCIKEALQNRSLTKEQRRLEFAIAAKLCSGKAQTREEALTLCSKPKPPSEAQQKLMAVYDELPCSEIPVLLDEKRGIIQVALREGEPEKATEAIAHIIAGLNSLTRCLETGAAVKEALEVSKDLKGLKDQYYLPAQEHDINKRLGALLGPFLPVEVESLDKT